jgi:hypothetical protein
VSQSSTYQKLRGHLAYLNLTAAAEALPAELERATQDKLSHTAFLEHLLEARRARRPGAVCWRAARDLPYRLTRVSSSATSARPTNSIRSEGRPRNADSA